jgi:hypothetical protein
VIGENHRDPDKAGKNFSAVYAISANRPRGKTIVLYEGTPQGTSLHSPLAGVPVAGLDDPEPHKATVSAAEQWIKILDEIKKQEPQRQALNARNQELRAQYVAIQAVRENLNLQSQILLSEYNCIGEESLLQTPEKVRYETMLAEYNQGTAAFNEITTKHNQEFQDFSAVYAKLTKDYNDAFAAYNSYQGLREDKWVAVGKKSVDLGYDAAILIGGAYHAQNKFGLYERLNATGLPWIAINPNELLSQ